MLEDVFLISLLSLGVHALTRKQSILGFYRRIAEDMEGELRSIIFEPISECLTCMASFWGISYFAAVDRIDLEQYFLFVLCTIFSIILHLVWKDRKEILKFVYLATIIIILVQAQEAVLCSMVIICSCGFNYLIQFILARLMP